MPTYLVERYAPAKAGRPPASPALSGEGFQGPDGGIRHVLSTLIPRDELVLSLYESPSEASLAASLAARGVSFIRIVEAVLQGAEEDAPQVESLPDR